MAASSAASLAPSAATSQLIAYGLLLGGAGIAGKLVIDALVGDMDAAKARRQFIGPIFEPPKASSPPGHVALSDVVRFVAMIASAYSVLADLPTLVSQFGQVQATVRKVVTP